LSTAEYDPERPQRGSITVEHHRAAAFALADEVIE
jgi:hypothetical protein